MIAIFLLHYLPWRGIFFVLAAGIFINAITFYLLADEVKLDHSEKLTLGKLITEKALWISVGFWTFAAGANIGLYAVTPLYLTKELGLTVSYANTILAVSRLGGVGIALLCGWLVDRISLKKTMFTMICLAGTFTVLLGTVPVRFIGISLFLQAVFVTGFFPVGFVAIARTFVREMRGMATGLIASISTILGGGLVPYLLGVAGDTISFRVGVTCLGISVCLSSLLTLKLEELE